MEGLPVLILKVHRLEKHQNKFLLADIHQILMYIPKKNPKKTDKYCAFMCAQVCSCMLHKDQNTNFYSKKRTFSPVFSIVGAWFRVIAGIVFTGQVRFSVGLRCWRMCYVHESPFQDTSPCVCLWYLNTLSSPSIPRIFPYNILLKMLF